MSIKEFIANHVAKELVSGGVDQSTAATLGDEAAQHWGEMSHCKGPIFAFLLD